MKLAIARSRTLWHISTKSKASGVLHSRYRVDYIFSLHRVYCSELRAYGWRLVIGRLQATWESKKGNQDA